MNVISIKGIHKTYPPDGRRGPVHALKGIDLEVEQGTICCILGPNGAGKTTLISILTTLLLPDKGSAYINGLDLIKHRNKIKEIVNVTSGNANFTDNFTVVENLTYYAMLYGIPKALRKAKIETLLDMFELGSFRDAPFNQLSTGLKQRLALSKSLINDPQVLFLDEPTIGLDPQFSESIRKQLKEINRQKGITIILTTHQMDEAEFLSDRVVFLREGQVIAEGRTDQLKRLIGLGERIEIEYAGPSLDTDFFSPLEGILQVEIRNNQITAWVDDYRKRLHPFLRKLTSEKDIIVNDVRILEPNLEDVFLELAKSPH